MPDTKISALAALTGANLAAADLAVVVDVSDVTMAASGTTKMVTVADLAVRTGLRSPSPTLTGRWGIPGVGVTGMIGKDTAKNFRSYFPFPVSGSITVTDFRTEVTFGYAGGAQRWALYEWTDTCKPGALLGAIGTTDGTTSGDKTVTGLTLTVANRWVAVSLISTQTGTTGVGQRYYRGGVPGSTLVTGLSGIVVSNELAEVYSVTDPNPGPDWTGGQFGTTGFEYPFSLRWTVN